MPASSASSSSSVQLPPTQLPMVSSPSCIAARLPTAAAISRCFASTQAALQWEEGGSQRWWAGVEAGRVTLPSKALAPQQ